LGFALVLLPFGGCAGQSSECLNAKREAAKLWAELDYASRRSPPADPRLADAQRQIAFLKGQIGSMNLLLQAVHNADEQRAHAEAAKREEQVSFADELDALEQESARACRVPGSAKCATAILDSQRIEKALGCTTQVEAACAALCKSTEPGMSGPSAMSHERRVQLGIIGCMNLGAIFLAAEGALRNQPAAVEAYDRACLLGSQDGCSMRDAASKPGN
jgi:hypothetical protein